MKRVSVLMGGRSAEREVSLATGKACAEGLRQAGYDVVEVDVGDGDIAPLMTAPIKSTSAALFTFVRIVMLSKC